MGSHRCWFHGNCRWWLQKELFFHLDFRLQALTIPIDRGYRSAPAFYHVRDCAVQLGQVSVDSCFVPGLHVAGIPNRQVVVVGAPEKRDVVESVAVAKHIARDDLTLAFSNDPMLHPQSSIRVRVGPTGDVARGKYILGARLEEFVDGDTVVEEDSRPFSQPEIGPDADTRYHNVGIQSGSIVENDRFLIDRLCGATEVEPHATVFVNALYEVSQLGAEYALQRKSLRPDYVDLEAPGNKGSGDLQAYEAGTDNHGRPGAVQVADDGTAVSERSQVSNPLTSIDVEADRTCTRSDEKGAIVLHSSVAEPHGFPGGVDLLGFDSR